MSMFSNLRVELLRSVWAGQALAGLTLASSCGATSGGDATGGVSASGGVASSGGHGGSSGGTSLAGRGEEAGTGGERLLEPYPLSGLTCFGRDYGTDIGAGGFFQSGYDGQCCYVAACYTPRKDQEQCLPANDDLQVSSALGFPAGSGTCGCGDDTHPAYLGPYAANPAGTATGACCYLAASIGCEGRPLRVDGQALIAELVMRRDWGMSLAA